MIFKIPEKYEKPILLISLLVEDLETWTLENVRTKFRKSTLRDPDLRNEYHRQLNNEVTTEQLFSRSNYCFVIKDEEKIEEYGQGPKIFYENRTRRIFFDASVFYHIPKGVNKEISSVNQLLSHLGVTHPYVDYWENEEISLEFLPYIEEMYNISIQCWMKERSKSLNRYVYSQIYFGDLNGKECILYYQKETEKIFLVEDQSQFFSTLFVCKNEELGCDFRFRSLKLKQQHEVRCGDTKTIIKQVELGKNDKLIARAEEKGLIPKMQENRAFIFYDIESCLPRSDIATTNTTVLSTHTLVSIAVNR